MKIRIFYTFFLTFLFLVITISLPTYITVKNDITTKSTDYKLLENISDRFVVSSFYGLILSFILSLFLTRRILHPLRKIGIAVESIRKGNLYTTVDYKAKDEFGDVAETFNNMVSALSEKTERLREKEMYINLMTDLVCVIDEKLHITDINPAFSSVTGYKLEELSKMKFSELLEDKEILNTISSSLLERHPREVNIISKKGKIIPVLMNITPVELRGRYHFIISMKDFREQKRIHEELKIAKEFIEEIINSIEDEILVIDKEYRVIMANLAVVKRFGTNPVGRYCYTISHAVERPCYEINGSIQCPASLVFKTGNPATLEHEHIDSTGVMKIYEISAYPIRDEGRDIINVIEVMRDITEKKENEKRLKRINKELRLLHEVSEILSGSLIPEEIFNNILSKLKDTFRMDGGGIFLIENEHLVCRYRSGVTEEFIRRAGKLLIGEDIPGRVAKHGTVITSTDVSSDPRVERSMLRHSGMKGYCCIPLKGKNRIWGVFCLFSYSRYEWQHDDENLLKSIGEMMGIAFDNIMLYEKVNRLYIELKEKKRKDLEDLTLMVDILSRRYSYTDLMKSSLDFIRDKIHGDLVIFLEMNEDTDIILKGSSPAIPTMTPERILYNKNVSSQESFSIMENVITMVKDIRAESRFYYHEGLRNYYSSVTIPVMIGEKVTGAVSIYSRTHREFSDDDIHFLTIFSTIFLLSLQRTEFYEDILKEKILASTILESIDDGVFTVDRNGMITSINHAGAKLFNTIPEKIVGKKCKYLMLHRTEPSICDTTYCPLKKAIEGISTKTELTYRDMEGRKFILSMKCYPLHRPDLVDPSRQNIIGAVHVIRNITPEKELDRMKTDLIRNVSHEFRTPLTAIIGMTEMIMNNDITEERKRLYLKIIHDEGKRLARMVSELLDISRLERRELLKIKDIDLREILNTIKLSFSDIIKNKKAILGIAIENDPHIKGDKEMIEQMLRNLIDNSLTYSDEGVKISVSFKRSDEFMDINVRDTGWGIPEKDIPHLGEKFYRGTYGERTKGTGLGLALTKEIVRLHGGTMDIKSEYGKGTNIMIRLPLRREDNG